MAVGGALTAVQTCDVCAIIVLEVEVFVVDGAVVVVGAGVGGLVSVVLVVVASA